MEIDDNSLEEFYLTLPSNDASKKYYLKDSNHSRKNQLDRTIRLEGTWQVGLSCLSVPTRKIGGESDSKLKKYLDAPQDTNVLLSTSRITLTPNGREVQVKHSVPYEPPFSINGSSPCFETFEANRISEIQQFIPPESWYLVSGVDNPADAGSRGILPRDVLNHDLWWHGPTWLKNDETT